jgi:hypothetical protein
MAQTYEEYCEEVAEGEADFELSCERAWLLRAEYDVEAHAEMVRVDG